MNLELVLDRSRFSLISTQGQLSDAEHGYGFTLEPPRRHGGKENVPKLTCIPAGGPYPIALRESPHFSFAFQQYFGSRDVPHVDGVPGRDHILLHPLNYPGDTEGCIGVGLAGWPPLADSIQHSRTAFEPLLVAMHAAIASGGKITLLVVNHEEP